MSVYTKLLHAEELRLLGGIIGAALMAKEWLAACGFDYSHAPENA